MAKKKKRAPAFPEKDDLIALCKLATKLAFAGVAPKGVKISLGVRKLIDAAKSEDLCSDGNDKAATIIANAMDLKYDDIRPLLGDDDSSDAGKFPAGVAAVHLGKVVLSLGANAYGDTHIVHQDGVWYENELKVDAQPATEKQIESLSLAQLKRLREVLKDREF